MTRSFALPSLMTWSTHKVTDHNRAPVSITVERIEEKTRMANGTMRKFVIADKRTFATSWTDVPETASKTVDGFWGKREIETFYNGTAGAFTLVLHMGDGTIESYNVMFSKFDAEISKRGSFDFWKVSVEMEEV
jgi:hypothetical protein